MYWEVDDCHFVLTQLAIVISAVTMSTLTEDQKLLLVKAYYQVERDLYQQLQFFILRIKHILASAIGLSEDQKLITFNGDLSYHVRTRMSLCF